MIIEIRGAEFSNKGSELMLNAVMEELGRSYPQASVVMDSRVGKYWNRARLGLYQKPMRSEWKFVSPLIELVWSKKTIERYGIIPASRVQIILDASGFAYTDQFKAKITKKLAKRVKRWKKAGKKIVLLPQALGPFERKETREAMLTVVDHVDLMFPRDRDSYDHIVRLAGERENVKMRPDFTNIVKGIVPHYFEAGKKRACLIPNSKMIEKTSEAVRDAYVPFMADCGKYLMETGHNPFLLIHETRDGDLAKEVKEKSGIPMDIIEERNAFFIKGIIGESLLVVGSRYHGLVSALSQGVPSVATGWSHKYQLLYEDYGCSEFLISDMNFNSQAKSRLEQIINEDTRGEIVRNLVEKAQLQVEETRLMWEEVKDVICSDGPPC